MGKNHANGKTFLEKRSVQVNDLTFLQLFHCRRMICRYMSFAGFLLSMLLMKSVKFGSRCPVDWLSEGNELWRVGSPGLAVHQCRDW